ncbi:HNH endonuclease signature motif containing protein [Lentzea kentuckyensis]|uniref:HNH endonuclease signature motif containing protein n=1 Tax=Lentzea kentuckyensis TaxID=360086 RepID=UPI000A3CDC2A|nr:HNH endonuclease signature motif containing protein [Lentzea kentuckyensis]
MEAVEVLDALAYHEREIAYHQAQSLRVLADYAIACEGEEFFDAEIAAAMRWTSRWTTDQIALALDLASKLPRTLDALEKGEIDLYKARVLHDKTGPLSADLATEVEERVLAKAPGQTGAQMRQLTSRVVMRVDPEGHKERAEERKKQRCTGIDAMEEDMARFWAYLPAHLATACYARVDAIARQTKTPTDPRTLDQVRADVVADLILATPDKSSAVKVELYVAVSAATLMGVSDQPGELAGYGPITADLARELAGDSTWRRLLTDPATGEALEFGTSTYRPPAALRRFVWMRDRTCRFPSCMRPSHKSDLDHTVPFPLGSTSADNLGAFCRRHHRVKHRTAWQVSQPKPGRFCFRSPAGRTYHREPEAVLGDPPPF